MELVTVTDMRLIFVNLFSAVAGFTFPNTFLTKCALQCRTPDAVNSPPVLNEFPL